MCSLCLWVGWGSKGMLGGATGWGREGRSSSKHGGGAWEVLKMPLQVQWQSHAERIQGHRGHSDNALLTWLGDFLTWLRNQAICFLKNITYYITQQFPFPISTQDKRNLHPHKHLHENIYSNIINNLPPPFQKIMRPNVHQWITEVVFPYKVILLISKEK